MNDTNSAATASVGEVLSNARKAAGWAVTEVASKLNLTVSAVEFLEQNQFAQLPGTTFARGYIRSYAKLLGLDGAQLAQAFDQQIGAAADVSAVHTIDRVGESRRVPRGMLQFGLFILFVVVLAAIYYGWQSRQANALQASNKPPVFERVEVERADGSMHVQNLDELEDQAVALALENHETNSNDAVIADAVESELVETEQVVEESLVETGFAQLPAAPAVVTENNPAATSVEDATEQLELAEGMGRAQLTFTNDCWLRVVDADGKQLAGGLQRAGEELAVSGKAPLDVHLGYARGVSVIYNGKAVDFSTAISGETARFKLGE